LAGWRGARRRGCRWDGRLGDDDGRAQAEGA
jgi:hypothetical protein